MYSNSWQCLGIALAVFVLSLQLAVLAAPLWIWLYDGDERVGIGLFYRVGFEPEDASALPNGFEKVNIVTDETLEADHWYAIMVLEVLSTVVSLVLIPLIIAFQHRASENYEKQYGLFRAVLWVSICAWLFNGTGMLVFILYHGDAITQAPDISHASFSWGALIGGCSFLVQFGLTMIIYNRFWGDDDTIIPASADPKMAVYPSTTNANASQFFQSYYTNDNNKKPAAAIEDAQGDLGQGQGRGRGRDQVQSQIQYQNQRSPPQQPQPPVPIVDYTQRPGISYRPQPPLPPPPPPQQPQRLDHPTNDGRRGDGGDIYRNHNYNNNNNNNVGDFQGVNGQAGFDNRGFAHSSPVGRANAYQRQSKHIVLDRDDGFQQNRHGGGVEGDEVVFNRLYQNGGPTTSSNQHRNSLVREIDYSSNQAPNGRKNSGFLVTAKHSSETDVHRDNNRTLAHTSKQPDVSSNQGQRLVLSPSNFTESNNVKYNPTFMYRPYSEQVY